MPYAINIGDLTKDKILAEFLVAPLISNKKIVYCEKGKLDGGAVLLECKEEQAKAIVDVIRIKWQKNLLRCYYAKKMEAKTWKRV